MNFLQKNDIFARLVPPGTIGFVSNAGEREPFFKKRQTCPFVLVPPDIVGFVSNVAAQRGFTYSINPHNCF